MIVFLLFLSTCAYWGYFISHVLIHFWWNTSWCTKIERRTAGSTAFPSASEARQAPLLISLHPQFNCDLWPRCEPALMWLPAAGAADGAKSNTFIFLLRRTHTHIWSLPRKDTVTENKHSFHIYLCFHPLTHLKIAFINLWLRPTNTPNFHVETQNTSLTQSWRVKDKEERHQEFYRLYCWNVIDNVLIKIFFLNITDILRFILNSMSFINHIHTYFFVLYHFP